MFSAPLFEFVDSLRKGLIDLSSYVEDVCHRVETLDTEIHAFLPEPDRSARLKKEVAALKERFPRPATRPPLYGLLIGVKDIFRVDGFLTRAGSQLPQSLFDGPEATCVSALRSLGALVLGKTATTEFAYREPGPTRNPRKLDHTPGGSSSGSAAAVAAGLCPLALGTQTIGSVIRPAAYCGVVGFVPSRGRISTEGVIPFSKTVDVVGLFAQDVAGTRLVASLLCKNWRSKLSDAQFTKPPVLGIPEGAYLEQASREALDAFERQLEVLGGAGFSLRRVRVLDDVRKITARHEKMIAMEMARTHEVWFRQYKSLYRPQTAAIIRSGQKVKVGELAAARASCKQLRVHLEQLMAEQGLDLWISPAATGPAPEGLDSTGSPGMNLPWTHAGLPAVCFPAGRSSNGLPLGVQLVGRFLRDDYVLTVAERLAEEFKSRHGMD
ncbi:MAG: amidase [Deltaproteobacteria bacterium]|nr:amidase [Deltaproteobacteria bacterium]